MINKEKIVFGKKRFFDFIIIFSLTYILSSAFSRRVRKEIKERANGYCESCHKKIPEDEPEIAAHIKHGVLNNSKNGKVHCKKCEAQYHLAHADNPKATINLTKKQNDGTAYGHIKDLPKDDQEQLTSKYSRQWKNILKRLKK
jgi:hypothetical protein